MRIFTCQNCGQLLHFENTVCMRCGRPLGFLPEALQLSALDAGEGTGEGTVTAMSDGSAWKPCANSSRALCNWLVPAGSDEAFCPACALNRTIPDLSIPGNLERWQALEAAKRRLLYALRRLGLPLANREADVAHGLAFDFLADAADGSPVLTGHDDGLVTINIAEADSAERERRRLELGEPYRTLLGHLRHEVGHYYWDLLVRDGGKVDAARAVFGDESEDYQAALERHYQEGAPAGWQETYVSAYATMHPWEDFAETFAHYLHITGTLQTAAAIGIHLDATVTSSRDTDVIPLESYEDEPIQQLLSDWEWMSQAFNRINRAMGFGDLYPFDIVGPVKHKLAFIHEIVTKAPLTIEQQWTLALTGERELS